VLGRKFTLPKEGSKALLYVGTEHLLEKFVIPNVGTDYNLYFCNSVLLLDQNFAVEPVSIRQTNKVLMQRY
jgi:hypothetical protein